MLHVYQLSSCLSDYKTFDQGIRKAQINRRQAIENRVLKSHQNDLP